MVRIDGVHAQVDPEPSKRRVAELLRVVSQAMAELAVEFDRASASSGGQSQRARRRPATVPVPEHVTDIDVAAARRALRRAGL
jgi:hypothetical protein